MMSPRSSTLFFSQFSVLVGLLMLTFPAGKAKAAGVDFATTIQTIFNTHCIPCHDGSFQYSLKTGESYANIVNVLGGRYAPYKVRPNNTADSEVYQVVVVQGSGPNHNGNDWVATQAQKDNIKNWIAQGALPDLSPPTLTGVSPAAGPIAGGTTVTLTGTRFGGTNSGGTGAFVPVVRFGGVAATNVVVTAGSFTQITCKTPAGATGAVDVTVTTTAGGVSNTLGGAFAFVSNPVISSATSSAITTTGATLGGTVTSDGGGSVTERGVVVAATSVNSNPQINGTGVSRIVVGTAGTGQFTVAAGGLAPGTNYTFSAYAINSVGTVYTTPASFRTLSNNASLSNLVSSVGALDPVFSAALTTYGVNVPNATATVTVTPTVADSTSTVTVNGAAVTSGTASSPIDLNVGANAVTILVTAEDGTPKTYNLTVLRASMAPSTLASLDLSSGPLSPFFDSATTNYSASVPNATTLITLTPVLTDAAGSITVNGLTVADGTASAPISLSVGNNLITVVGIASDATSTTTYKVNVTRAPSSNADLASLVPGAGGLSPVFNSALTEYTLAVAHTVASIAFTAIPAEAHATLKINGGVLVAGSPSSLQALTYGDNAITVEVRAQDGATVKTYAITITRATPPASTLSSLALSAGTLSPAFAGATTAYSVNVQEAVASLTVTPTLTDAAATVTVNSIPVDSGSASAPISLNSGSNNLISIVSTASDASSTTTYTIAVTRGKSSTATLAGLVPGSSTLSPAFDAAVTSYSVSVPLATKTIVFTPTAAESHATLQVKGMAVTSGSTSANLPLMEGDNLVPVVVTAEDGTTLKTYTVTVRRGFGNLPRIVSQPAPQTVAAGTEATFNVSAVGAATLSYQWKKNNVAIASATSSSFTLASAKTTDAASYTVVVSNALGSVTSDAALLTVAAGGTQGLPHIDTQPVSLLVPLGQPASFSATASGAATLAYQWRKAGVAIGGATTGSYTVPATTLASAATYSLQVKNSKGAVISAGARLGVVSTAASKMLAKAGTTITLKVSAAGDNLLYQWRKDGVEMSGGTVGTHVVSGATAASLVIKGSTNDDTGSYTCVARLGALSLESGATSLKVYDSPPLILLSAGDALPAGIVSGTYAPYQIPVNQGSNRAVVSFAAAPLPAGLKIDATTGIISGRPTVASAVNKPFNITLTATNGVKKHSVAVVLTIAPLPAAAVGTFNGLVDRDPLPANGLSANAAKLISHGGTISVTTLPTGIFSGKVTLGTLSYSFINQFLEADPANPTATVTIPRALPLHSLMLSFAIDKDSGELTGTVTDGVIASPVHVQAWRGTAQPPALVASYNSAIDITPGQTPDPAGDVAYPHGYGFATLAVTATGAATWSGKLADRTVISGKTTVGSTGKVPLHLMLYGVPGSVHGWVQVSQDTLIGPTNGGLPLLDGNIDWVKDTQASTSTNHNYKPGFGLHQLMVVGGKYSKPATAVLGLADAGAGTTNARLTFTDGGIGGAAMVTVLNNTTFRISSTNLVTMPTGAVANPVTLALKLDAVAGAISGTCLLKNDPDPTSIAVNPPLLSRSVSYAGLLVTRAGLNKGYGYFLLSKLPSAGPPKTTLLTSDVLSGQVVLDAK